MTTVVLKMQMIHLLGPRFGLKLCCIIWMEAIFDLKCICLLYLIYLLCLLSALPWHCVFIVVFVYIGKKGRDWFASLSQISVRELSWSRMTYIDNTYRLTITMIDILLGCNALNKKAHSCCTSTFLMLNAIRFGCWFVSCHFCFISTTIPCIWAFSITLYLTNPRAIRAPGKTLNWTHICCKKIHYYVCT